MDNPRKWLSNQAEFLRFASSLRAGWVIEPDHKTGNLIVHDGKHGFVVSGPCLRETSLERILPSVREWTIERIAQNIKTAIADIDEKGSTNIASVYTLAEMREQAKGPTRFDPIKEDINEAH